MTFSTVDTQHVRVISLVVTDDRVTAELSDGRTISVPLSWYPRLCHGTAAERQNWRLIGSGRGIHWSQLDEDISVENLIFGKPSAESQASLNHWLSNRNKEQD
jgi:hypothetical protein